MHCGWFFLGQDFAIWTISMETVIGCVFFVFRKLVNSSFAAAKTSDI